MKVKDYLLFNDDDSQVEFIETPNQGGRVRPIFLVIHYTAGTTLSSAISWFQQEQAKASAHLIIDQDGKVVQMVSLETKAWHAGKSRWGEIENLNAYSVGIELVNAGRLDRQNDKWVTWYKEAINDAEIIQACHKNESVIAGWQIYTQAQIEKAVAVAVALNQSFEFEDILGHDDIAPRRKSDPGPAFPMASFKSKVLGRR